MAHKVGIEAFESTLSNILEEYGEEIEKKTQEVVEKVGKAGAKALRETSPKRTGKYAKGWHAKIEKDSFLTNAIIYNEPAPGLAHLLENGHAKRGGGRTRPFVHIKPIEEQLKTQLQDVLIKEYG